MKPNPPNTPKNRPEVITDTQRVLAEQILEVEPLHFRQSWKNEAFKPRRTLPIAGPTGTDKSHSVRLATKKHGFLKMAYRGNTMENNINKTIVTKEEIQDILGYDAYNKQLENIKRRDIKKYTADYAEFLQQILVILAENNQSEIPGNTWCQNNNYHFIAHRRRRMYQGRNISRDIEITYGTYIYDDSSKTSIYWTFENFAYHFGKFMVEKKINKYPSTSELGKTGGSNYKPMLRDYQRKYSTKQILQEIVDVLVAESDKNHVRNILAEYQNDNIEISYIIPENEVSQQLVYMAQKWCGDEKSSCIPNDIEILQRNNGTNIVTFIKDNSIENAFDILCKAGFEVASKQGFIEHNMPQLKGELERIAKESDAAGRKINSIVLSRKYSSFYVRICKICGSYNHFLREANINIGQRKTPEPTWTKEKIKNSYDEFVKLEGKDPNTGVLCGKNRLLLDNIRRAFGTLNKFRSFYNIARENSCIASDGHKCASPSEREVDNMLTRLGINHDNQADVPLGKGHNRNVDFLIRSEDNTKTKYVIEVTGVDFTKPPRKNSRCERYCKYAIPKFELLKKYKYNFLLIYHEDVWNKSADVYKRIKEFCHDYITPQLTLPFMEQKTTDLKYPGYWTHNNNENIAIELKSFIAEKKLNEIPTLSYLLQCNRSDLKAAIMQYSSREEIGNIIGLPLSTAANPGKWGKEEYIGAINIYCFDYKSKLSEVEDASFFRYHSRLEWLFRNNTGLLAILKNNIDYRDFDIQ